MLINFLPIFFRFADYNVFYVFSVATPVQKFHDWMERIDHVTLSRDDRFLSASFVLRFREEGCAGAETLHVLHGNVIRAPFCVLRGGRCPPHRKNVLRSMMRSAIVCDHHTFHRKCFIAWQKEYNYQYKCSRESPDSGCRQYKSLWSHNYVCMLLALLNLMMYHFQCI